METLFSSPQNALPPEFELKVEFLMLLMKVHAESSPPVFQVNQSYKLPCIRWNLLWLLIINYGYLV